MVLITGANGEVGHGLIHALADEGRYDVLALDLNDIDSRLAPKCAHTIVGDVLDKKLLGRLVSEFEIHAILHLAALLSTRAEFTPSTAHAVNVEGTLNLLELAVEQSRWHGARVKFVFPSSIAAYGLPDLETKARAGRVKERDWTLPTTMYGCNKLYCEHLGRYYSNHYRQLAAEPVKQGVDFRAIRFPGLISAFTVPSGGTSDYIPEMLHAAAKGEPYACFVREDTQIPFMAMPDAVDGMLRLAAADTDAMTRTVYNIGAFNPSAGDFAELIREAFPGADIRFEPDEKRQAIVDSWPLDVEDSAARRDWGFAPRFDLERTMKEYLLPNIRKRYGK